MSGLMHADQGVASKVFSGKPVRFRGRKVVQIAMWQDGSDGYVVSVMYALCTDGTVWAHRPLAQPERWDRVVDVPSAFFGETHAR